MTTAQESHAKTEQLSPAQWLIATVTVFFACISTNCNLGRNDFVFSSLFVIRTTNQ